MTRICTGKHIDKYRTQSQNKRCKHLEHTMKNFKTVTLFAALIVALGALAAHAQITPSGDAYTNTATSTTNFGAKALLDVQSASQTQQLIHHERA